VTSSEPAEIQRVRALAEQAVAAAAAFTGASPQECADALALLAAAEESAGGRPEVLAWLGSRRAGVWERWAQVVGPHDRRAAWEAAVDAGRAAVTHTPGSLLRQNNLAVLLLQLYGVSGQRDALDETISLLGRVLAATPPDDPGWADRAANLAVALEDRFRLDGDSADLDAAIAALRAVTELQPDKVAVVVNLATLHRSRFRALGQPADLAAAEHLLRRVYAPDGDPAVAGGLGLTLARQFETVGGEATLDEAITLLTDAVDRTPARDPLRPARLTNLALALLNRAEFVPGPKPMPTRRSRCCGTSSRTARRSRSSGRPG
jgi:tetratricopeptide (TPR) repeat protein